MIKRYLGPLDFYKPIYDHAHGFRMAVVQRTLMAPLWPYGRLLLAHGMASYGSFSMDYRGGLLSYVLMTLLP